MTATVVKMRRAVAEDEAMLLDWANDPVTRAASRVHDPIEQQDHHRWLEQRLSTPDDARIWIGEADGVPVGVVRFERRAPNAVDVSITVAPEARGRGFARPLLDAGIAAAREAFGQVTVLADILPGNDASVRLFTAAGFSPIPTAKDGQPAIISLQLRAQGVS